MENIIIKENTMIGYVDDIHAWIEKEIESNKDFDYVDQLWELKCSIAGIDNELLIITGDPDEGYKVRILNYE